MKPKFDLVRYGQSVLQRYGEKVYELYLKSRRERPELFPTANLADVLKDNPEGHCSSANHEFGRFNNFPQLACVD